jgi:hypothetical protein
MAVLLPVLAFAQVNCIKLLIPLPCGTQCIDTAGGPMGLIQTYVRCIYPWVVGTAAGIAVLWTIISGAALIFYAGDDSKRSEAKGWFKNALIGLFIVLFSAMIMNFINPLFFSVL